MTNATSIRQFLNSSLSGLRDNTKVIENTELLDFNNIKDGVLTVYSTWSGQAIINCAQIVRTLYEQNYNGQIIVIDTDCMTPDFQTKMFGLVCEGWGEIFTMHNGTITKKYLGKDSFEKYRADNN